VWHRDQDGIEGLFTHDPLAAICAVDPSPFTFREDPVRVAVDGIAEGMTLQRRHASQEASHAWSDVRPQRVAVDVDIERALEIYAEPFFGRKATA
jgi:inosine-uridine nucleoside N-ribohydrolase